jgi:DNA gyrase subunit A
VRLTSGSDELIIATRQGKAVRFDEKEARETGRVSRGVRAIRLSKSDEVVGMARIRPGATLLTVSESGLGRRTALDEYPVRSRGGKGVINYYVGKNGPVAGIKAVDDGDDIIVIADVGVFIRIPAAQIAVQSRYGGGVRVMRVGEDCRVVTLARVSAEENESDEGACGEDRAAARPNEEYEFTDNGSREQAEETLS